MIKHALFSFLFVFSICKESKSQYYFYNNDYYDKPIMFEIGASIGGMNCFTDLGGRKGIGKSFTKDMNLKNTQLAGSVYFSATYNNAITLRLEGTFGQVSAYDSILKNVAPSTYGRYERNLSFRSTIKEVMLVTELHPLYLFGNFEDRDPPLLSPYLVGGIGCFVFNPQAKLNNSWVYLHPLHTEGEGLPEYPDRPNYELVQINIPMGAGLRYELSPIFNIRAEVVYRKLNTDYLDDVSQTDYVDPTVFTNHFTGTRLTQALLLYDRRYELDPNNNGPGERGSTKHTDAYFTFNLKIGLTLGRERIKRGGR